MVIEIKGLQWTPAIYYTLDTWRFVKSREISTATKEMPSAQQKWRETQTYHIDVTRASWRLKSPATRLFVHKIVQDSN